MKDMKEDFLKEEVWVLAFSAAFQRANVYGNNVTSKDKQDFKTMMRGFIEAVVVYKVQSSESLIDEEHLELLHQVIDYSSNFENTLANGTLNLGVAQKLVNLILKYYWCLGLIKEPPHFPIDRIIQRHIDSSSRINWTEMTKDEEYLQVINAVRDQALAKGETLAQWELRNFERR